MNKFSTLTLFSILSTLVAYGQLNNRPDQKDDPYDTKTCGLFGLNYLSDNVYLGRKDTITIPYYSPYIGYHHSSGIYAKGMASYTTAGSGGHIDVATLEAGYEHSFEKNIDLSLNADRYFYNKNSVSIRANMVASTSADIQFTNKILEPGLAAELNFNKNSKDIALGAYLDHEFDFADGTLYLYPTATVYGGTSNYYDEYFVNRLNKKDKTLKLKHVVSNASQFKMMEYEFSCRATLRAGHWLFLLKPTFAIPLNPATVVLPKRNVTETLTNTFFLELDICYRS